jgi:hypothetical protein
VKARWLFSGKKKASVSREQIFEPTCSAARENVRDDDS